MTGPDEIVKRALAERQYGEAPAFKPEILEGPGYRCDPERFRQTMLEQQLARRREAALAKAIAWAFWILLAAGVAIVGTCAR